MSAKKIKREDGLSDAGVAFGAIVTSGEVGGSRWQKLVAAGLVRRDGEDYFLCMKPGCKNFSQRLKNDGKGGSSNAFAHVLACNLEALPHPLMCDALLLSRAKVEKTLEKWAERLPTGGSLSSFVHKEVLALSKSPGTMRLDMTFREKFTTLADAVAEGIAISGVPLDAASSSLVGAIVKLWDPDCPIPSPDAIATRIGPLFKDAASKLSELVRRILHFLQLLQQARVLALVLALALVRARSLPSFSPRQPPRLSLRL